MINLDYAIHRKINRRSGRKVHGCPRMPNMLSLKKMIQSVQVLTDLSQHRLNRCNTTS